MSERIIKNTKNKITIKHFFSSLGRGWRAGHKEFKKQIRFSEKIDGAFDCDYTFIDRRSGNKKVCIVLAGYKEFMWDSFFERFAKNVLPDMDVCICSSGLELESLKDICRKYNWSYLATKMNNVNLIQNAAIHLHPNAEFIFKVDEDIIVTKNLFQTLEKTYERVAEDSYHDVGFVSPLLPINTYGYVRLLDKLSLVDSWEKRFGRIKFCVGRPNETTPILHSSEAAKFMWGESEELLRDIDVLNEQLQLEPFSYSVCHLRFSIGVLLFSRDTWEDMGMFPVRLGNCMGIDEETICHYCMFSGKAIVIAENVVAGHLSYGPQNEAMEQFYTENRKLFLAKN